MNLNDTKSSGELRREISQDLDRLDRKVDHLKERLTPGQVLDDAVFSAYRGDPRGSYNYLKENPIGTSFLALGTLLLMDNNGESYEKTLRKQSGVVYQDYKHRADLLKNSALEARDRVSERIADISGDIKTKTREVKEKGIQLKEQLEEKISRSKTEIRDNVIDASQTFKERAQESLEALNLDEIGANDLERVPSLKAGFGEKVNQVRSTVREYSSSAVGKIKENNLDSLSYVALGLGAGFAIGGLIPLSEDEISVSSNNSGIDFSSLRREIEQAANESINIFKDEFVETLKKSKIDIF